MQMAQVVQRGLIFFVHALREIRIAQPLIAREFRHVLEHAQPLLNGLLPLRRQVLPCRQNVIPDVLALLRRHLSPRLLALALISPLLRSLVVPLRKLIANAVLLLGGQIAKRRAVLHHSLALLRTQVAHPVNPGSCRSYAELLASREISTLRIWPRRAVISIRSSRRTLRGGTACRAALIRRWPIRIPRLLALFLLLMRLRVGRGKPRTLRVRRQGKPRAARDRKQPCTELESQLHPVLHRLIRLIRFIRLHWLRQILQRFEARNHVMIFQHRHVLHHLQVRFLRIAKRHRWCSFISNPYRA